MIATNEASLVTLRLVGVVQPPQLNVVVDPNGQVLARPGQAGVVLHPRLGDPALGWVSDHVEPGVTLAHPDPDANEALQQFSCVGNRATVVDGAAAGAEGLVFGKHGGVLVTFTSDILRGVSPGDRIAVEATGVGLRVEGEADVTFHSCSPGFARRLVSRHPDGTLRVPVRAVMPREAAGAGIGMLAARYNLDLQVNEGEALHLASALRLGDIVAILDQDHRYLRVPRPGWLVVGIIAHGQSGGGGHGLGLVTLLTGPEARIGVEASAGASFAALTLPE